MTLRRVFELESPLSFVVTKAKSISLLRQSLALCGTLQMNHLVFWVVCCMNLVVFSSGLATTTPFLFCFFHPDFLEVLSSMLAFLPHFDLEFCIVEIVPPIL